MGPSYCGEASARITVDGVGEPGGITGLTGRGPAGRGDGFAQPEPSPQLVVELLGELTRGPVGDRPQRADERTRSGLHEGLGPAVEPVVRRSRPGRPAGVEEDDRRG